MGRGLGRVRPPPTTCRVPRRKCPSIAADPLRRRSRVNESGLVWPSDSRVNKLCRGPGGRGGNTARTMDYFPDYRLDTTSPSASMFLVIFEGF